MDVPLYFYLAYKDMDRLSAGSDDTTLKAIGLMDYGLDEEIAILDVGCGVGTQTVLLSNYFKNAVVEAVDLFDHYVAITEDKTRDNDNVYVYRMDMNDLDFANEDFDVVFSEASINIIGFERGLKEWKRMIKPNGYLIASDITWLKTPSAQSKSYWKSNYDEVDTIKNKIKIIEKEGYEFVGHVIVPKEDWKSYHKKLEENLNALKSDKSAKDFVKMLQKEIEVYRQNPDDFSYVFYVMRKANHQ